MKAIINKTRVAMLVAAWGTIVWGLWEVSRGRPELGFYGFMTYIYAASAVLFYRKYRRMTPGIVTTSLGFIGWAAISPLGLRASPGSPEVAPRRQKS